MSYIKDLDQKSSTYLYGRFERLKRAVDVCHLPMENKLEIPSLRSKRVSLLHIYRWVEGRNDVYDRSGEYRNFYVSSLVSANHIFKKLSSLSK